MFGLMIRKAFYDFWDSFFKIVFLNVGFILTLIVAFSAAYPVSLIGFIPDAIKIPVMIFIVCFFLNLFTGALNIFVREIVDNKSPGFKDFFIAMKKSMLASTLYSAFMTLAIALFSISMSFWGTQTMFIADAAKILLFGAAIIFILANMLFFPIYAGLEKSFFKAIKKMFLVFLDNPVFSFGLMIISLAIFAVSVITVLMIPGYAAVALLLNVGLKYRLLKYDYIQEHPEADPTRIPWTILLAEERERVGTRSLRGLIFPWKD